MHRLHTDSGHIGRERTLHLIQQWYFSPRMTYEIKNYISKCLPCLRRKSPTNQSAPLVSFSSSQPLDLIYIDLLGLEQSKGGYEKILVMTDHFTRYVQAIPCKNKCAKTTAKGLFEQFVNHFGFLLRLQSDQGRNFESKIILELSNFSNQKSRTTSFHPQEIHNVNNLIELYLTCKVLWKATKRLIGRF